MSQAKGSDAKGRGTKASGTKKQGKAVKETETVDVATEAAEDSNPPGEEVEEPKMLDTESLAEEAVKKQAEFNPAMDAAIVHADKQVQHNDNIETIIEEKKTSQEEPDDVDDRYPAAKRDEDVVVVETPVEPEEKDGIEQLIYSSVCKRASRAPEKLRSHLAGRVAIVLGEGERSYLFQWQDNELQVSPNPNDDEADCSITLSEEAFVRIANGELNPQVGMLADRIEVRGQIGLAMYFFNLVAPRSGL